MSKINFEQDKQDVLEKTSNIEKRESFGKAQERNRKVVEEAFDRVNKEVKELAKDMDALEKAGTEQSIMDQYQNTWLRIPGFYCNLFFLNYIQKLYNVEESNHYKINN